mmetsp:Transcript_15066/g.29146  ORF Transcript_15066/g.29146 Transcript_15066/m.29146 type:complete len:205 (+) Transcript_15066:1820-2434(+)
MNPLMGPPSPRDTSIGSTFAIVDILFKTGLKWKRLTIFSMNRSLPVIIVLLFLGFAMLSFVIVQDKALNAAFSMGSPLSFPSTATREWHPTRTFIASLCGESGISRSLTALPRSLKPQGSPTPSNFNLVEVRVPVLSKQQASTLPANGILNGSVQKMNFLKRESIDVFTASESSMGSSGGMTDVIIITQFRASLKKSLLPGSVR